MRIAITADLHWGMSERGDAATRALHAEVLEQAPDAFIIAGDVGEDAEWSRCLELFRDIPGKRLVLPGNHDLWTRDPGVSSLDLYERDLPQRAAEAGFHYLDPAPWVEGGLALVGSINWYDYSFADADLKHEIPSVQAMFRRKLFPQGRHNDGRFVRLGMDDGAFTGRVVERFQSQLAGLPESVTQVVTIQHHPPVRVLFYPTPVVTVEQRIWVAYTGNRRMQEAVMTDPRITTVVCGHTHAYCEATLGDKRCINIGSDYPFKRLLLLDTETGEEQWWEFGRD